MTVMMVCEHRDHEGVQGKIVSPSITVHRGSNMFSRKRSGGYRETKRKDSTDSVKIDQKTKKE